MDLTKRQQEIFDFIRKYSAKYGYPPTVRDIGKAVGLASSSTVHAHLANLEKIGLLRRDPSKPRAIELLDRAVGSAVDSVRGMVRSEGLPLLGSVAAGQPVLAEENIEDYVSVPEIAGGGDGEYVLRIRGDSMKDAGILEGDLWSCTPRTRRRTARLWWLCWARRRPSSASFASQTMFACSPRTTRWSRSEAKRSRCSVASWVCSGRCDRHRGTDGCLMTAELRSSQRTRDALG